MKTTVLFLLVLSVTVSFAKKNDDPAVKGRKEFCHHLYQLLEQETGWNTFVRIAPGRDQDILQLYPGMDYGKLGLLDGGAPMLPEALVRFKRDVVDPLLAKRQELKALGFKAVQIKISSHSESFPHGVWDIPLD